jgi:hypothetical protein
MSSIGNTYQISIGNKMEDSMGKFNQLLDWLRNKSVVSPEELAKRKARQDAIARYNADSLKHAQYVVQNINAPAPVLQNYLDDPNYVWDFKPPTPKPPNPRPI